MRTPSVLGSWRESAVQNNPDQPTRRRDTSAISMTSKEIISTLHMMILILGIKAVPAGEKRRPVIRTPCVPNCSSTTLVEVSVTRPVQVTAGWLLDTSVISKCSQDIRGELHFSCFYAGRKDAIAGSRKRNPARILTVSYSITGFVTETSPDQTTRKLHIAVTGNNISFKIFN